MDSELDEITRKFRGQSRKQIQAALYEDAKTKTKFHNQAAKATKMKIENPPFVAFAALL